MVALKGFNLRKVLRGKVSLGRLFEHVSIKNGITSSFYSLPVTLNPYTFSDLWTGYTYISRLELTRNWIAFSIEFIYWGHIFSGLWGKENFWYVGI